MPRAELDDLRLRSRRVWRHRHQHAPYVLHWQRPGKVWPMDFSAAPQPIDGCYPSLLAVRDLASHQQLLWLPVRDMTADTTTAALRAPLVVHGAPLVLKADNGAAFIADATRDLLYSFGVHLLFSPPRTPQYNGSIEAGIGSLKIPTERFASRAGHAGYWAFDDVAAGQSEANATARPRGETGPTPDQFWQTRRLLTPHKRRLFQETVLRQRDQRGAEEEMSSRLNTIFGAFQNPTGINTLVQSADGKPLTYWNNWNMTEPGSTDPLQGALMLVSTHDGNCVSWSEFFAAVLQAQGLVNGRQALSPSIVVFSPPHSNFPRMNELKSDGG